MDVSSVNYQTNAAAYAATSGAAASQVTEETEAESTGKVDGGKSDGGEAAVYEPSTKKQAMSEADRKALVGQLKAELEQRQLQFYNTVKDMLAKQGKAVSSGDGFWRFIASGDYTVDEATKAEAQKNIAEDGYWGVEQTSDRIVKYATALSGGDPEKLDTMIAAFEKGYKAAEKAWGGALPEISQRTRTAVMEKFDKLKKEYAQGSDED